MPLIESTLVVPVPPAVAFDISQTTGASTGAHLHFEVHAHGAPTDPFAWLLAHVR